MKTSLKAAIAGILVTGGTFGAGSAFALIAQPNTGNGGLVLFVRDTTSNQLYARGLGVNTLSVLSQATITANQPYSTPVTLNYSLPTLAPDAALTAFLGGANAGHVFTWAIQGGKDGIGTAPGQFTYITTTLDDLSMGTTVNNANLLTLYPALNTTLLPTGIINGNMALAHPTSVLGDTASLVGAYVVSDFWNGAGPLTTAPIGSTQNFYGLTSAGGKLPVKAQIYILNTLTMSANGTLSATTAAPVPLPAAVWLLGSGLLGLVGVGRRRAVTAA